MRIVLDANLLLSAFGTRGLCSDLLGVCLDKCQLFISDALLAEVNKNLIKKFKLPASRAHEIVQFLTENFTQVSPQDVPLDACRDADDCIVLGTALACNAEILVTGDQDLLVLKQYRTVVILSPRAFYEKLREQ